jgi:hypothetical protein
VSIETAAAPQSAGVRIATTGPEHCIARRPDGVYADPAVLGTTLLAAVDGIYRAGSVLVGLDYPVFIKALFGHGAALPQDQAGATMVRIAADIQPFDQDRRALYRSVKIASGRAEYYFEPVWLPDPLDPDGQGQPTRLDLDEFVADVWLKGIRFGIEVDAVRAAIASGKADRVTVARRLEPVAGEDARIVEVSDDLHRNDAPRQLANGRLDLHSFQNRFPQIQQGVRLLQKVPASAGTAGCEMSGAPLPAKPGRDTALAPYAGPGTKVERLGEGAGEAEFLVAQQPGFLSVDAKSGQISVGAKVVSRDGVSAKTTGNLQLSGDYEEFGEVQEKRAIEADSITVHADVFGNLVSRGGTVHNKHGDIRVRGVASGALLQASDGAVVLERAENCIVAATRVRIAHAINCEIIGDEVDIGQAEGSVIAGRRVSVEYALPRKQGEMLVCVLRPDGPQVGEVIEAVSQRIAQFGELAARHKAGMERLTAEPEVRRYLLLASKVRKGEISLSPEQARQLQKMAQDVAPALKAITEVSAKVKAAEAEQEKGAQMLAGLEAQRRDAAGVAAVRVRRVQGDTQVRVLGFNPAAGSAWLMGPREIKARLRGPQSGELLFSGADGSFAWDSEQAGSEQESVTA